MCPLVPNINPVFTAFGLIRQLKCLLTLFLFHSCLSNTLLDASKVQWTKCTFIVYNAKCQVQSHTHCVADTLHLPFSPGGKSSSNTLPAYQSHSPLATPDIRHNYYSLAVKRGLIFIPKLSTFIPVNDQQTSAIFIQATQEYP